MGRNEGDKTTIHHRNPRSTGGSNHPSNISLVPDGAHKAWHRLFHNFGPISIAAVINQTWLHADWRLIAVPAEGFFLLWQLANWVMAMSKGRNKQGMDGDGI